MDINSFFNYDLKVLSNEDKLQLLRIFNCFAKISYLKKKSDSDTLTLSCRNEEDLVLYKLNDYLGDVFPPAFLPLYNYLKDNYCQELLEDGGVYPSQEYLCEVYPEMLRRFLSFSTPVMNCDPPFSKSSVQIVLDSLNIQNVCDLTANGSSEGVLFSSVLRWMVEENNSVEEEPDNYVLYDAVIDYDFLYAFEGINMATIEHAASLRTNKYVLIVTHLGDYQADYLRDGKLVCVQLLEWSSKKEDETYLLAFDLRGGYDKVDYPEEGKSFSYQELQAGGGKLDYRSVGIKWLPKPIGWKPPKRD